MAFAHAGRDGICIFVPQDGFYRYASRSQILARIFQQVAGNCAIYLGPDQQAMKIFLANSGHILYQPPDSELENEELNPREIPLTQVHE